LLVHFLEVTLGKSSIFPPAALAAQAGASGAIKTSAKVIINAFRICSPIYKTYHLHAFKVSSNWYLATKTLRHQNYRIILYYSFFNPDKFSEHGKALSSARAGNVIGGGDWARDRIIPDCIRSLEKGEKIFVRNPLSTRPWQLVLESLGGYLLLAAKMADAQDAKFLQTTVQSAIQPRAVVYGESRIGGTIVAMETYNISDHADYPSHYPAGNNPTGPVCAVAGSRSVSTAPYATENSFSVAAPCALRDYCPAALVCWHSSWIDHGEGVLARHSYYWKPWKQIFRNLTADPVWPYFRLVYA